MSEKKQELNEFIELEKNFERDRKIMLLGIIKGMEIEKILQQSA